MNADDAELLGTNPVVDFPVVGVGASAGGLEAVTEMFRDIEKGTGMAFVLVMHLDPDHESLMAELLGRKMHIAVRQIADHDTLQKDCLHIIPPGFSLHLHDGELRLQAFSEPRGIRRPIDSFFSSLARSQGHKAACVILSGTGADGTAGLRTIKEYGGICAVQIPEEARYDGMPFSAISTKLVDFTLSAPDIVPRVQSFFEHADEEAFPPEEEAAMVMKEITAIIHKEIGHDFSGYKKSTLMRRLFRRLQVLEYRDPESYLDFLRSDANEQSALAQDFLINVTSFFRDPEHFEALRQKVIVPLIENADASDEIRVWVPGCSSGQEAYTLAMLIEETCDMLRTRPLVQIFATDIDRTMITQARKGQYAVTSFSEIPAKYRDKYTAALDGRFEITKRVREMVRFSIHNVIQDPPFSKIDLISCRNLLIYLGDDLQKELFPLLHFSLKPGGTLFLGGSENATRRDELFSFIDQRARIFRRKNLDRRLQVHLPLGTRYRGIGQKNNAQKMRDDLDFPRHRSLDAGNLTIYEQYAPPFVRVSADGRILDSSGDLSLFLMSRPGEHRDLNALARPEVRNVVLPLVADAIEEDRRRALKDIEVTTPFGVQNADIIAHPMKDETVAVIFLVKDRLRPIVDEYEHVPVTQDKRIADLQEELMANRLLLKSKVEEIETANEELKSSNEEMMSMNEELQSANEELTTANEELKNKIDELTLANADLDNFMRSADLAMIVLDRTMRIRHVTEAAKRIAPISTSDQGRALGEFNISFGGLNLLEKIRDVIETGKPVDHTTDLDDNGKAYFIRVIPFFFGEGVVDGASVTIVDISHEVELRQKIKHDTALLNLAMQSSKMGYGELDMTSGMGRMDEVAAKQLGLPGAGSYSLAQLTQYWDQKDAARAELARTSAAQDERDYAIDFRILKEGEEPRWYKAHGARLDTPGGAQKYAMIIIDLTDEMQLRQNLFVESERVKLAMRAGRMGFAELDVSTDQVTVDSELANQLEMDKAGVLTLDQLKKRIVDEDVPTLVSSLTNAIEEGREYEFDFRINTSEKFEKWLRTRGMPYEAADGSKKVVGPTVDVTAEKMAMRYQETLVKEMSHRIKNLFSVISALVQSSPKANKDVERFANELVGRVVSLGRAHDLARTDAHSRADLRNLLKTVIGPHVGDQDINLDGPDVDVAEGNISVLSLVLHELATNATKHGALRHADGAIDVAWQIADDGMLALTWAEKTPGFVNEQGKDGFGSRLMDIGVKQLRGEVKRNFTDSGVAVEIRVKIN